MLFPEKQLLEALSVQMQKSNRSQVPTTEQIAKSQQREAETVPRADIPSQDAVSSKKGKGVTTTTPTKNPTSKPRSKHAPQVPRPPEPLVPVPDRLGVRSPLVEAGILLETVKVALNQQAEEAKKEKEKEKQAASGSSTGKPKKKVLRVRG